MNDEVKIEIKGPDGTEEIRWCAQLMAASEPWITLGRTYDDSLKIVGDPSKEVYLAAHGDALVGFVILNMRGAFVGYIQTLCVAPECRGEGIGSLLIKFAEQRILSETPNVFMCVSSFNKAALRLYERLGYDVVGELRDYVVAGHSEILLRKTIAPLAEFRKKS